MANEEGIYRLPDETAHAIRKADHYARQEDILLGAVGMELIMWALMSGATYTQNVVMMVVLASTIGFMTCCVVLKSRWRSITNFRLANDIKEFTRDKTLD